MIFFDGSKTITVVFPRWAFWFVVVLIILNTIEALTGIAVHGLAGYLAL